MTAMRPTIVILAFLALIAPARARADESSPELHLAGGVEIEGARGITSTAFRGQALLGTQLGSGHVRPSIAAGVVVSTGALYVDDPRAAREAVGIGYTSVGPVVQLGLHVHSDDHETAFLFASAAHLRTSTDARLMLDAVPGVDGGTGSGMRASLGVNWARGVAHVFDAGASSSNKSSDVAGILLFALPQQIEVTVERDTGSTRTGATLSWGF